MIAEQLACSIRRLLLGSSRPQAIWFIDRPEEYYQLLKTSDAMLSPLTHPLRFYGLPLHTVNTSFAFESNDYYYIIPFYKKSGIWVEMSDGNHVRLADE